eukprot:gene7694-5396_t
MSCEGEELSSLDSSGVVSMADIHVEGSGGAGNTIVQEQMRWEDWDALTASERRSLTLRKGLTSCAESTAGLIELCREENPDPKAVRHCVERHANLWATCPLSCLPILHRFIVFGSVACAESCLFCEHVTRTMGPYHVRATVETICDRPCVMEATHLLQVFLSAVGLAVHGQEPSDTLQMLVCRVAARGCLSAFWPVLRDSCPAPVGLLSLTKLWAFDWASMPADQRTQFRDPETTKCISCSEDIYAANAPTASLWRLSLHCCPLMNADLVRSYVEGGADINFIRPAPPSIFGYSYALPVNGSDPFYDKETILQRLVKYAPLACVEACLLYAAGPIDFTIRDGDGVSVLYDVLKRMDTLTEMYHHQSHNNTLLLQKNHRRDGHPSENTTTINDTNAEERCRCIAAPVLQYSWRELVPAGQQQQQSGKKKTIVDPSHLLLSPIDDGIHVLRLMVHHAALYPGDRIDFSNISKYRGDFLSLAAARGILSKCWPVLLDIACFADNTTGIPLRLGVVESDWEALGEAEQRNFVVLGP